jgi:hypothetical protein
MAIGPVDTVEEAQNLGETYAEDELDWRVFPLVAPEDAMDYEPPLLVRPGKEPVFHTVNDDIVAEAEGTL